MVLSSHYRLPFRAGPDRVHREHTSTMYNHDACSYHPAWQYFCAFFVQGIIENKSKTIMYFLAPVGQKVPRLITVILNHTAEEDQLFTKYSIPIPPNYLPSHLPSFEITLKGQSQRIVTCISFIYFTFGPNFWSGEINWAQTFLPEA